MWLTPRDLEVRGPAGSSSTRAGRPRPAIRRFEERRLAAVPDEHPTGGFSNTLSSQPSSPAPLVCPPSDGRRRTVAGDFAPRRASRISVFVLPTSVRIAPRRTRPATSGICRRSVRTGVARDDDLGGADLVEGPVARLLEDAHVERALRGRRAAGDSDDPRPAPRFVSAAGERAPDLPQPDDRDGRCGHCRDPENAAHRVAETQSGCSGERSPEAPSSLRLPCLCGRIPLIFPIPRGRRLWRWA